MISIFTRLLDNRPLVKHLLQRSLLSKVYVVRVKRETYDHMQTITMYIDI